MSNDLLFTFEISSALLVKLKSIIMNTKAGIVMNAEIIAVGTELLHGDIANTNAQFISKKMAEIGVDVYFHTVVGDNKNRIKQVFDIAIKRADIIISTGGLGPTQDDITKESLAELLDMPMTFYQESMDRIEKYFEKKNKKMSENNVRQAYFPKDSYIIPNSNGTADACKLEHNGKIIYLLPGPPREVIPLVEDFVMNDLAKRDRHYTSYKMIQILNMGESEAEMILMDFVKNQTNPTIASYADEKKLVFRITAKDDTKELADIKIDELVEKVLDKMGENARIYREEE